MKCSSPIHPLEALFVKLPLDRAFENETTDSVIVNEEVEEENDEKPTEERNAF